MHSSIVVCALVAQLAAPKAEQAKKCLPPVELAERYRTAVLRGDADYIISLLSERGLACMDKPVPKKAVAYDLKSPRSFIWSVVFDGERLRKIRAREHWEGAESLREYFSRPNLRVRIGSLEPAFREASQSVCIKYEVEDDERPDAQLCAHCVAGAWVVVEWEYECRVSRAAMRSASVR